MTVDLPTSMNGLTLIRHDDAPRVLQLYKRIIAFPWFWEDELVQRGPHAMQAAFVRIFASPTSVVFDILDDAGVLCFDGIFAGWKARVHVAVWERRGYGRRDLLRRAARIVCDAHDLLIIEGFVPQLNHLALRIAEKAGMRRRGWIKDAVSYNGVTQNAAWLEVTREELAEGGNHGQLLRAGRDATAAGATGVGVPVAAAPAARPGVVVAAPGDSANSYCWRPSVR